MISSQLTVGDLRSEYFWICNPGDPNDPDFLKWVNRAHQRMLNSGEWEGSQVECIFDGSSGYIILPYDMDSILGVTIDKLPVPVFNRFHQYIECGPGTIGPSLPTPMFLMDGGECMTVVEITPGQRLRFVPAIAADAGKIVRVFGTEYPNKQPLFDVSVGDEGIPMALTVPNATISTPVQTFTGLQKAPTLGRVDVYGWDGATATLLSQYQPYETRPVYKRYQVGQLDSNRLIGCLCKLRHIDFYNDTDFLRVGNKIAWEYALKAMKFALLDQYENSETQWKICFNLLNQDKLSKTGKARQQINVIGPLSGNTRLKVN